MIILHHLAPKGYPRLGAIALFGDFVMWVFFAMSGYGLVFSYLRNEKYLDGFLKKSLLKLFIPYLLALVAFVIYRYCEGIDQIELFKSKGLYSFVPTSWFIYVLSYFYIFYFVIFRYVKSSVVIKVLLLCGSVLGYCWIAPKIGVEPWRWNRCPGFCIGAIIALCNQTILEKSKKWHILLSLVVVVLGASIAIKCRVIGMFSNITYILGVFSLFGIMYLIDLPDCIKKSKVVEYISSISLEMFIIQSIALYVVVNDFQVSSTIPAVIAVFAIDIACASIMHYLVKRIRLELNV